MSAKARPTRKGCGAKEQPVCDLCAGPFKYCINCASAPSLHREFTDSLILFGGG